MITALFLPLAIAADPTMLVALADGTALHVAPSDSSATVRLDLRGPPGASFRLVGERDGWVEVGELTNARSVGACLSGSQGNMAFELRFWVRPVELRPVIAQPLDLAVAGGGRLTVRAGIPVTEVDEGLLVMQDGLVLHLPAGTPTGDRWAPPGPPDDRVDGIRIDPALALGLTGGGRLDLPAGRSWGRRSGTEAAVVSRCWTLALPPDAPAFAAINGVEIEGGVEGGIVGGVVGGTRTSGTWRIPGGAAARWADGGEAGVTRWAVDIAAAVVKERGDDVCFAYTGHPVVSGEPELCVARAGVVAPAR